MRLVLLSHALNTIARRFPLGEAREASNNKADQTSRTQVVGFAGVNITGSMNRNLPLEPT
jgi:hypothetical protein